MTPFFRAHVYLSTCRTMNGVIPWTALDAYAKRHPEFDDFPFFEEVIYGFEKVGKLILEMKRESSDETDRGSQTGSDGRA